MCSGGGGGGAAEGREVGGGGGGGVKICGAHWAGTAPVSKNNRSSDNRVKAEA